MILAITCLFAMLMGQSKPAATALAFCPDGKQVVAGSLDGLRLLTWPDLQEAAKLDSRLAHIHAVVFSPNQTALLVAGGRPGETGELEIFSWPDLKNLVRFQPHADLIYGAAWSPDGGQIVTGGADNACAVLRWTPGAQPERVAQYLGHSKAVTAVAFLPDGKQVVSASVDQSIQVWDALTARPARSMDNHLRPICDLTVRPAKAKETSPAMLATTGEDRTVRLWQPTQGRLVRFTRQGSIPRVGLWSPTGDSLVVGCDDGQVLWLNPDSANLEPKRTWDTKVGRVHTLAIHPESGQVVVGGENGLGTGPKP